MKIQKLIIHNIASIAHAEIDFEKEPLINNNLFLICGETGAGKTTILDAVCLALFGKTPRFSKNRAAKDSVDIGGSAVDKVEQLMRRNTVEAYVDLSFMVGNQKCVAKWEASRARKKIDGKLSVSGTITIDGIQEKRTDETVEELIGLNFEQFCRTTMLAQGEFTKFLISGNDEKAEILEKLTNTTKFARYGQRIFEITNEQKKKYETEYNKISAIAATLLTDDDINRIQNDIVSLKQSVNQLTTNKNNAIVKRDWLSNYQKISQSLDAVEKALQGLKEEMETPEFKEKEQLIVDWDISGKARSDYHSLSEQTRKQKLNTEKLQNLKDNYAILLGNYQFLKDKLQTLQNEKQQKEAFITNNEPFANMFSQSQGIITELNTIIKYKIDINKYTNLQSEKEKELPDLEKKLNEAKSNFQKTKVDNDNKQKEINEKTETLQQLNRPKIEEQRDNYNEHLKNIINAENAFEKLQEKVDQLNTKKDEYGKIENQKNDCNNQTETLSNNFEKAKSNYEKTNELYEKTKLSIDNAAKVLRHQLKIGDDCPVCGQKVAKIIDDDDLMKILEPIEKQLNTDKQLYDQANEELTTNQIRLTEIGKQLKTKNTEIDIANGECEKAKQNLNVQCELCEIAGDAPNIPELLARKKVTFENTLQTLKDKISSCNQLQEEINSLQKEKDDSTQKNFDTAKENCTKAENSLNECNNNIEKIKNQINTFKEQATSVFNTIQNTITYSNWQHDWKSDNELFIKKLSDEAKSYNETVNQLVQIENQIVQLQKDEQHIEFVKTQIINKQSDWENIEPATAIEDRQLVIKWNELNTSVTTYTNALSDANKMIAENQRDLAGFYSSHATITEQRLAVLCQNSDENINLQRKNITEIKDKIKTKEGEKAAAEGNLTAHRALQPPLEETDTIDTLNQLITNFENDIKLKSTNIGSEEQKLKSNEESKAKIAAQKVTCDALKEKYDKWEVLNKKFGDKEGKTFRKIIQSYVLKQLLVVANLYLDNLSNRYRLDSSELTLTIIDSYESGAIRPVNTLSGGESFIVSLALALGLSNLNKQGLSVEMLFIDEGFGTLSGEYLNTVMAALEHLNANGSRKVGIISHVETLRERIKTHIEVTRNGYEASIVRVVQIP